MRKKKILRKKGTWSFIKSKGTHRINNKSFSIRYDVSAYPSSLLVHIHLVDSDEGLPVSTRLSSGSIVSGA